MAALTCSRCGAPLPPPASDTVTTLTCHFCGTTTTLERAKVGKTELRKAIRQVLAEDAKPRPQSPPKGLGPVVLAGAVLAMASVGAASFLLVRSEPLPPPPPLPTIPRPPAPPPPVKPSVPVFVPPVEPVSAFVRDEHGDFIGLRGAELFKLDGQTLQEEWKTPAAFQSPSIVTRLLPRNERIAVVGSDEVRFFDAETGAATGRFLYTRGGILQGVCGMGRTQLRVKVLGAESILQFDALTAKRSSGGPLCSFSDSMPSAPGQRTVWNPYTGQSLVCRNELVAKGRRYRECETDDGTRRQVIAAVDAKGKVRWTGEAPSPEVFFGEIGGQVLVGDGRSLVALDAETGVLRWTESNVLHVAAEETSVVAATPQGFVRLPR